MAASHTPTEAAAALGITVRTLYRWVKRGHLPADWRTRDALPRLGKLPKGPKRDRYSARYTRGRHRFDEVRGGATKESLYHD
jgi:hypothetical protein